MPNSEVINKDRIHVINTFQKEVESLESSFKEMLQTLQERENDSPEATLQHILLLDHAVDQASVRVDDFAASPGKVSKAAFERERCVCKSTHADAGSNFRCSTACTRRLQECVAAQQAAEGV